MQETIATIFEVALMSSIDPMACTLDPGIRSEARMNGPWALALLDGLTAVEDPDPSPK